MFYKFIQVHKLILIVASNNILLNIILYNIFPQLKPHGKGSVSLSNLTCNGSCNLFCKWCLVVQNFARYNIRLQQSKSARHVA